MSAPDSPILHAARLASVALAMALDTERRAALEVEARGGDRSARLTLDADRRAAADAILRLLKTLPASERARYRVELQDMADGITYARPGWALRIVQMATEVGDG